MRTHVAFLHAGFCTCLPLINFRNGRQVIKAIKRRTDSSGVGPEKTLMAPSRALLAHLSADLEMKSFLTRYHKS
ncbi:hypothetical protein TNCV_818931 [Trichonephila clavipes]|nr:hypothetical protein TNCV_818931 [Trichonephila clavipes]